MRKISDKGEMTRQSIVDYMKGYQAENGILPTFAEIQDAMGFASKSTVAYYMDILVRDGKVKKVDSSLRRSYYVPL